MLMAKTKIETTPKTMKWKKWVLKRTMRVEVGMMLVLLLQSLQK